jgi:hypothetical protein
MRSPPSFLLSFAKNTHHLVVFSLVTSKPDYDAVALTPSLDIPAECDQTQFETASEDILTAGIQLASKLKQVKQNTIKTNKQTNKQKKNCVHKEA